VGKLKFDFDYDDFLLDKQKLFATCC